MAEIDPDIDKGSNSLRKLLKSNISIQPEEAAKNIDRSNFYETNPDSYSENKEAFDADIESIESVPDLVEKGVREFASQSNQHSALVKEDYSKLNFIEKRIKYWPERIIDLPERRRQLNEHYDKLFEGDLTGEFSEADKEYEADLRLDIEEMSARNYGIDGEGEQFAVEVFGAIGDMFRVNKSIIAASTVAGAGVGGLVSAGIPVPGARVVGVSAGAASGFGTGVGLAFALDAYKQSSRSVIGELRHAVDDKGVPLNLEPRRMLQVSVAVGLLSGLAAGISGKILSSKNPMMKKFISSKTAVKTLMKSPALLAKMQILGATAVTGLSEGGEEAFQEMVQIIGVNFGKMDENEASFINAFNKSVTDIETWKRTGKAALLGGVTGATVTSASGGVVYTRTKRKIAESQNNAKVLQKQNSLVETAAAIKSTKVNELSPNELNTFVRSLVGIDEEVLLTIEDMKEFANTPEKGELLQKYIDPEILRSANELNTTVGISEADMLQIIAEEPTFSDYLRLEPEGKNPKEIRTEAQDFVTRLDEAETKREEIEAGLGVDEELSSEQKAEIESKLNPEGVVNLEGETAIESEQDFIEDIRFEPIEGIVSEEDVQVLNTKELDARLVVSKNINIEEEARFDKVEEKIFRDIDSKDVETQIKSLDKEHQIISRFQRDDPTIEEYDRVIVNHKKKGFSALAIDPRYLTEDQREIFLKSETLRKRKTFVEGGVDPDEAAAMAGVEDGDALLKMLNETPTKAEIKRNRTQRKIELRTRVQQTTLQARSAARDAAFTKMTKLKLQQMDHFRSKEWPTLKRGTIKIIGRTPTVAGLNRKAKVVVDKTLVRNIKPKKYEYGEIKSKRKAVESWLKTEFEQSYKNIEASALNNELRRESINAKEQVVRADKFWKRVKSDSNQKALKDAGMLKAMAEFTDVYKMSIKPRGITELNSFTTFIKKQDAAGDFTPYIPERLNDVTKSSRDMTVEQYAAITEMGEYILAKAKKKNEIVKLTEDRKEFMTAEKISQEIKEVTEAHANFDPKKADKVDPKYTGLAEAAADKVKTSLSMFSTIKTNVIELDEFVPGGYFQNLIGEPIKKARDSKRLEMFNLESSDKKIINEYGLAKFKKMFNQFIEVPEFNDMHSLGDGEGTIRKIDLLTLMAYMGDPEGRKSMINFTTRKGERLSIDQL